MLLRYSFIDFICTCLLPIGNLKFFLSIFLEPILIKIDSLMDAWDRIIRPVLLCDILPYDLLIFNLIFGLSVRFTGR